VQIGSEGAAQLSRGLGLSDDNVKPSDPIRRKAANAEELCQLTGGKRGERREAESWLLDTTFCVMKAFHTDHQYN